MPDLAALVLALVWSASAPIPSIPPLASLLGPRAAAPAETPPVYRPEDRAVSSWRSWTRRTLEPAPLAIVAGLVGRDRPVVTRCVKLNNPWCIKRARWTGEIGGDEEGHTAFSSTEAGADAAASLLRTYYVDLGRHAALDIVRRWAPAECRIGDGAGLPVSLAVRGLANTLRARFLASRARGGTVARGRVAGRTRTRAPRVSAVPSKPLPSYRVPDIAAGMGERPAKPAPAPKVAEKRPVATPRTRVASAGALPPLLGCGSEEGRIQNYGNLISRALGVGPSDDLKLFDAAGLPTQNLLAVMVAMSAAELGYLHAGPELVEAAIGRLRDRITLAAKPEPKGPAGSGVRADTSN